MSEGDFLICTTRPDIFPLIVNVTDTGIDTHFKGEVIVDGLMESQYNIGEIYEFSSLNFDSNFDQELLKFKI